MDSVGTARVTETAHPSQAFMCPRAYRVDRETQGGRLPSGPGIRNFPGKQWHFWGQSRNVPSKPDQAGHPTNILIVLTNEETEGQRSPSHLISKLMLLPVSLCRGDWA